MRVTALTFLLASISAVYNSTPNRAFADYSDSASFTSREVNDLILDTRDALEDLGLHARTLHDVTLSTRRLSDLESRMDDMEDVILEARLRNAFTVMKAQKEFKAKNPSQCPSVAINPTLSIPVDLDIHISVPDSLCCRTSQRPVDPHPRRALGVPENFAPILVQIEKALDDGLDVRTAADPRALKGKVGVREWAEKNEAAFA
ncbi:hypothetical protein NMY22_g9744 [Coprinellus aureogranulatus]|nr:hypothetical protein NMY22_g9744 [Coprinellus aureogranulatus]